MSRLQQLGKRLFITATLLSLASGLFASIPIYIPPTALLKEVSINRTFVTNNPSSANAYFELAMSYAYTGQIQKGWETLKKIPDYDENFAPTVFNRYLPLAKENPNEWKYPFKLAFAYYFLKERDNAIASFQKVLDIDPNHVWAMGFTALILGEQHKEDETIAMCKRALKIEPNATGIHFLLAEAYRRKGKYFPMTKHTLRVGQLLLAEKQSGLYDE